MKKISVSIRFFAMMREVVGSSKIKLEVEENLITPKDAVLADELFMAVTTMDIVGIVKFDGQMIGDGRPGAITKKLAEEFKKFTK